jgi:competence protein ComEA
MMWLFMKQYRKLLALCAIPLVVAATFFGYRLVHAQSNQDKAFAVNKRMQSLLDEIDGATPVPSASTGVESPPPEAGAEPAESNIITDSAPASVANGAKTSSKPKIADTKQSSKPKPTVKPAHTPKPKAAAKPKATPKPKAAAKPKATPKPSPVPSPKTAATPAGNAEPHSSQNPNDKINLNTATLAELMALPQIGESKAKAIIVYREQVNGFKTLEELVAVKGIGPKIFEKIKAHLEL